MCRRRILLAEFMARIEDKRLPKCVMFGKLVGGTGCVRGLAKIMDGMSLGQGE